MNLIDALRSHAANDPEASAWLAGIAKKRFSELGHKGWDWQSFYNGWIEGLNESLSILCDNDSVDKVIK